MTGAEKVRLQKAIAHAGVMSRRKAEEAIAAGRVTVDGRVAVLGDKVDPGRDTVLLDGAPLPVNPAKVTLLLNKPPGVISTADDPQGRPTVVDLVGSSERLYPVGRLDADSEGLLLLTNDGDLANIVTHPSYGITKTYLVMATNVSPKTAQRLTEGIELDDGTAKALSARIRESAAGKTLVEVVMVEGRNREIRRMFQALGCPVERLVRTAIGPITDQTLKPGESRRLGGAEIQALLGSGKIT